MSDPGRQSFTDKTAASMKPDSQKGMMERTGDKISGTKDSVASTLQPESQKSGTQRVGDNVTGNESSKKDAGLLSKAKNAVGMGGNSNINDNN